MKVLGYLILLPLLILSSNAKATDLERTIDLVNSKGEKIGTASLSETRSGVRLSLRVSGLTPGKHGVHIHDTGICALPDFKSAGDHFRTDSKLHGFKNPKGPHEGDLPNLEVQADGSAKMEMVNKAVTLKKGSQSLLKPGGTSLVIHAKPDDQHTDPSGDSGDRIACGIIEPKS